jgi:hypothetical protein
VDAPEGTEAEAVVPLLKVQKTRTVGLPLESRISIARNDEMVGIIFISSITWLTKFPPGPALPY